MSAAKKPVKSRIIFTDESVFGVRHLDVTSTFNMTERQYLSRDIDMLVENEDGDRLRIKKEFIAAIKEVVVVEQEVKEINE